jgi:hypothetical protein
LASQCQWGGGSNVSRPQPPACCYAALLACVLASLAALCGHASACVCKRLCWRVVGLRMRVCASVCECPVLVSCL